MAGHDTLQSHAPWQDCLLRRLAHTLDIGRIQLTQASSSSMSSAASPEKVSQDKKHAPAKQSPVHDDGEDAQPRM